MNYDYELEKKYHPENFEPDLDEVEDKGDEIVSTENVSFTLDQKAQKLVELEAIQKDIKKKITAYKIELLDYMQRMKMLGMKLEDYTLYRGKKTTPRVTNFELLKKSLDKENIPYLTKEVFAEQMDVVFRRLISEDRLLDGLEAQETEYIGVRLKKKGGE